MIDDHRHDLSVPPQRPIADEAEKRDTVSTAGTGYRNTRRCLERTQFMKLRAKLLAGHRGIRVGSQSG